MIISVYESPSIRSRELRKKIIVCYIHSFLLFLVYFLTHAFIPISDRMAMTKCIEKAKTG
jgi:hypothetical protein